MPRRDAARKCHGGAIPPRYQTPHISAGHSGGQEETAMTPQERQLIADLFERLAALENQPRDPEAERVIREGLAKAPHAVYPLVQTALLQDEALKQADAHIRELEAALQQPAAQPQSQPKGFLDNMRDSLFGRDDPRGGDPRGHDQGRGSVPPVRSGEPMGVPPQYQSGGSPWGGAGGGPGAGQQWGGGAPGGGQPWGGGAPGGGAPQPMPGGGGGGSFLGTAAAAAAGAIGGGLLMGSIRNMLGGQQQKGPFAGAMDQIAGGGSRGSESGGDLAREAGLQDVGRGGSERAGLFGNDQDRGNDQHAGLMDGSDDSQADDSDFDDDDFDDGGSDTEEA
jgi:hypothetical protein